MNRYICTLAQIMAGLTVLIIIAAVIVADDNGLGEAGGILLCVLGGTLAFQSYAVVLAIDIRAKKASVRTVGKILVVVTAVAFLVLVYETTGQSDKQTPMLAGTLIGAVVSQLMLQRLPLTRSDLLPREIKTEHLHIYTDLESDSARFYADFFEGFTTYFKENYFDFCQEGARASSRETKTSLLAKILALFGLTRKHMTQRALPSPDRPLDVYLFRNRLRHEFYLIREGGPATRHGYYSPHENLIVVNLASGLGTATHELVHHFVARGFNRAQCPQWVDEGFAMFFEKFLAHFDEQGKLTISFGYFSNWPSHRQKDGSKGSRSTISQTMSTSMPLQSALSCCSFTGKAG